MNYRYADPAEYDWLMAEIDRHETAQAMALGPLLTHLFAPKSVIDVGCGSAIYLVPFREQGCEIYGVDGAPEAGGWARDVVELVDLRNPWTPPHLFDLCLCIEVAEHLQCIHADTLVETLSRCAPLTFFSAARPKQGGEGHHCEQKKEWWVEKFGKVGFHLDSDATAEVHRVIDHDEAYAHCHWLRWNAIVLRRS